MTEYEANFELNRNTLQFEGIVCKNQLQADLIINSGDKNFVFTQAIASDEWLVRHNLNKITSITVIDSSGAVQIPDEIIIIDNNTILIKFISAFAGKAAFN